MFSKLIALDWLTQHWREECKGNELALRTHELLREETRLHLQEIAKEEMFYPVNLMWWFAMALQAMCC